MGSPRFYLYANRSDIQFKLKFSRTVISTDTLLPDFSKTSLFEYTHSNLNHTFKIFGDENDTVNLSVAYPDSLIICTE